MRSSASCREDFSLPREVMPTLDGAEQADILLPLPLPADASRNRDHEDYNIIGKLKPGVSIKQAQAEMDTITAHLRRDYPETYPPNGGLTFGIVPLLEQVVGDVRRTLYVLLGAVAFVLLIACANVANLLLSRAVARQKEIAIRTAMGANRIRIARQLLTESILLALSGGVLGVLFSYWSLHWIHILGPKSVPRLNAISINRETLIFTFLLSLLSGILFGLAPALRASLLNLHATLKDADRGSAGTSSMWGHGNNLRRLLVVSELALCVMLLIGAGLLIRSFARLQDVQPGFNPRNVLTLELTMSGRKYDDKQTVLATYHQLFERLERLPGVTAAGAVTALPLSQMFAWGPITVEGRVLPPGENFINADERMVNGHYFQAMEIPLLEGRLFNDQDTATSPRVLIVDDYMAQQLWPNQDPVGKRIHFGGVTAKAPWVTVVGVVGRIKQYTLDSDSRIAFYLPQTQYATRAMNVVVRSGVDPAALALGRQAGDPRTRWRSSPVQRANHDPARRRVAGATAILHAAAGPFCLSCSRAGHHRYLRRHGVSGQPGYARDRNSNGAGRNARRHSESGRPQGHDSGALGRGHRFGRCLRLYPIDAKSSVWCGRN